MKLYLLYVFGPLGRITKGHEYTVGQNCTHNDHAEKGGKLVKEIVAEMMTQIKTVTGILSAAL